MILLLACAPPTPSLGPVGSKSAEEPLYGPPVVVERADPAPNSQYGLRVEATDVDADGYDELLVVDGDTLSVHVHAGGPDGVATTPTVTLEAPAAGWLGRPHAVGDLNGDGYNDIVAATIGTLYVYYGGASGLGATPDAALTLATDTSFGYPAAAAGDVNGDGYADVLVAGAASSGTALGQVYVLHGGPGGLTSTATTTFTGTTTGDAIGSSLAGPGDLNGDGYDDIAIGQPKMARRVSRVWVWWGSPSGVATVGGVTLYGAAIGDAFGWTLSGADVNGDAFADLVVGAPEHDGNTGYVSTYAGAFSGLSATASGSLAGDGGDRFGNRALGLGDVNEDGYDEVLVSSAGADTEGVLHFLEGSTSGLLDLDDAYAGANANDQLGYGGATAAGDFNGDGIVDVAAGAFGYDDFRGRVYLFLSSGPGDADGDGWTADLDCDDADASVTPGASEVCNGVDDDCDGSVDEAVRQILFQDADGDGRGTSLVSINACAGVTGYSTLAGDCADADSSRAPGLADACDGIDNDCDGRVDERAAATTCTDTGGGSADRDGDGWGAPSDCADNDPSRHPGAAEACNLLDDDCDGEVDEATRAILFLDSDGDGRGTALSRASACIGTAGYASLAGDCDDADPTRAPGEGERCDGADNDCDGTVDEAVCGA